MSMLEITGAGKGGSRRDPIDHPNTLQARSTARLIDLISEGPIYGLVEQTDRLRSIFMDDTPCTNTDGSVNYAGVAVHERYGYSDQDVMPGFAQVESDISAGHTLTTVSPFLFTVSDSTVKQVRLRVRLGGSSHGLTGKVCGIGSSVFGFAAWKVLLPLLTIHSPLQRTGCTV